MSAKTSSHRRGRESRSEKICGRQKSTKQPFISPRPMRWADLNSRLSIVPSRNQQYIPQRVELVPSGIHDTGEVAVDMLRAQVVAVVLVLLVDDEVLEHRIVQVLHVADITRRADNRVGSDLAETLDIGEAREGAVGCWKADRYELDMRPGGGGVEGWGVRATKVVCSNDYASVELHSHHRCSSDDWRLRVLVRHRSLQVGVVVGTVNIISRLSAHISPSASVFGIGSGQTHAAPSFGEVVHDGWSG